MPEQTRIPVTGPISDWSFLVTGHSDFTVMADGDLHHCGALVGRLEWSGIALLGHRVVCPGPPIYDLHLCLYRDVARALEARAKHAAEIERIDALLAECTPPEDTPAPYNVALAEALGLPGGELRRTRGSNHGWVFDDGDSSSVYFFSSPLEGPTAPSRYHVVPTLASVREQRPLRPEVDYEAAATLILAHLAKTEPPAPARLPDAARDLAAAAGMDQVEAASFYHVPGVNRWFLCTLPGAQPSMLTHVDFGLVGDAGATYQIVGLDDVDLSHPGAADHAARLCLLYLRATSGVS